VRNDHAPRIAENYYLQIGQEVGVAGMAVFAAINILIGKELWKRRQDPLSKILLATLIGLSVVNMLLHAWTDDTLAYLWWGLTGIALAPAILEPKRKKNGKTKQAQA
jgi:O-antigen ligase